MNDDGRESDDAEWLLAQLANDRPTRREPPVAPPSVEPPAPTDASASPAPPRREESLDWFSLAEPVPEPDAATRALPVIGEEGANDAAVPPAAAPVPPATTVPPTPPVPPTPAVPPTPPVPASPLTSVEPPVGRAPGPDEMPPGPVTPASPFALTWADDHSLDSEDGVRSAFRNLTQPGEQPAMPGASSTAAGHEHPAPAPASEPAVPAEPSIDATSPFAGYTPPPVARQTFTPVGGNPIVRPPQPEPSRHPIAPTTAPAGWDEQRGPVAPAQTPAEPPQDARPAQPAGADYDHELWSALVEPEPPAPATRASAPTPTTPTPFPAFASADDAGRREPEPSEPVDDLLAAFGGASDASTPPRPDSPVTATASAGTPDARDATPPQGDDEDDLGVLGIDFGDDADDSHGEEATIADEEPGAGSPIAETGFAWNLTPDPSAPDPMADAGPVALERPSPVASDGTGDAIANTPAEPIPTSVFPAAPDMTAEPQAAASAAATGAAVAPAPAAASPAAAPAPGPRAAGSDGAGGGSRATAGGGGNDHRTVRTLLWIAGGLVVLVVLAGLFYLGTRLAPGGGDAASGSPAATTASETPVPEPTAVQPPGVHAWNTLFGGECLAPFPSAWENEYTVVDCAAPHAAQLVHRGELAGDAAAPFPGEEALAAQMADLCRADGIIDAALVAGMNDLQVAASYPVESQWAEGERTFYCFANRSGGEPLTGSITGPGPAA